MGRGRGTGSQTFSEKKKNLFQSSLFISLGLSSSLASFFSCSSLLFSFLVSLSSSLALLSCLVFSCHVSPLPSSLLSTSLSSFSVFFL